MKETTEIDTSRLRDMAKDTSVLIGNDYRVALNAAADEIDRLMAERDQWRKQALEEDAAATAGVIEKMDAELLIKIDDLSKMLLDALMLILAAKEDDFVAEDGEPLDFDDGGNYTECGEIYRYGEYAFNFRKSMEFLEDTPHPFPENNGSTRNNRAFLQQFATREGAEAAMKRLRDALNGGAK